MSEHQNFNKALEGRRVLELSDGKGLYCGKMLAELGADVIKIEKPEGDPTRKIPPFKDDIPHSEKSLYFAYYNLNKRSVTLNLDCLDGQKIFKKLAETADIVIETFSPGYMKSIGLSYPELKEINNGIIMVSITNFGQSGPYRDYKASDLTAFAVGGPLLQSGDPEKPPCACPGQLAYDSASLFGAQGALFALYHRNLTGQGQHVDVSMQASVVSATVDWGIPAYSFWDVAPLGSERMPKRQGSKGAGVPGDIHPTKDNGWVRTVVLSPWQFRRLTDWMGNPDSLADEVWENFIFRIMNRDFVEGVMDEWSVNYTKEELREGAFERGIPMVPVQSPAEFFNDPQPNARNYFVEVNHAEIGKHYYPGAPYRLSETPWQYYRPAPMLGEHNEDIYQNGLGLSKNEIIALRANGVI